MPTDRFVLKEITGKIIKRLLRCEVGDIVSWDELTALIGKDARLDGRSYVWRARRMITRDGRMVFGAILGVGLKRLDPSETIDRGNLRRRKIANQARYGLDELATLDDHLNDLPEAEQHRLFAHRTMLAALRLEASAQRARQLFRVERDRPVPLDMGAFKGQ